MPKNPVTDPITDQEIAFAQLLEHRNAVTEKLAGQQTEGLPNLNFGRDQILARLWELANLNPEQTRGSITGQIKAMSMILAMEGFLPGRRLSSNPARPAPAAKEQPAASQVPDPAPPPKPAKEAASPVQNHNQPSPSSPFTNSKAKSWVPGPMNAYDVNLNASGPLRLPNPHKETALPAPAESKKRTKNIEFYPKPGRTHEPRSLTTPRKRGAPHLAEMWVSAAPPR